MLYPHCTDWDCEIPSITWSLLGIRNQIIFTLEPVLILLHSLQAHAGNSESVTYISVKIGRRRSWKFKSARSTHKDGQRFSSVHCCFAACSALQNLLFKARLQFIKKHTSFIFKCCSIFLTRCSLWTEGFRCTILYSSHSFN